ncbi:MAG: AsnC family protein [Alphaproteobacteria bacterium]|nr:AsnC family protein [Alphaproteobacteria bacterium]
MELSAADRELLAHVASGLPLTRRPFFELARKLGRTEDEVIARLRALREAGAIKRLGLVVRHRELGYSANAMVVWDVPDDRVDAIGARMCGFPFVTLCYRRRRALPDWPYNLFAMIHGTNRDVVTQQITGLVEALSLQDVPRSVLFSRRRFKQRGAHYGGGNESPTPPEASWTTSIAAS